MRAIVTVIGKDTVGILAKVSCICADVQANIIDVSQTVMQDLFAMIMLVDLSGMTCEFELLSDRLSGLGDQMGLSIRAMHEDIFNSMHRI